MPEIIDNVKVGLIIKQLLKDRKMTQDDLASALNITKSAVSQNLNGKSTFDIQNLMQIAKLFNISVDELLSMKSTREEDVLSEYEKVVIAGLEGIRKVSSSDLRVHVPDLYGKVLIEYVIERREKDLFRYLDEAGILFVEDFYHRAKEVYLKIIVFALEERLETVMKYIRKYAGLAGAFSIDDAVTCERIWRGIEETEQPRLIPDLFAAEQRTDFKFLSIVPCHRLEKIISRQGWLDVIARYRLPRVLGVYLDIAFRSNDFASFVKAMLAGGYPDAVVSVITRFSADPTHPERPFPHISQEAVVALAEAGETSLFEAAIAKNLFTDLTEPVLHGVLKGKVAVFDAAFGAKPDALDYRRLGAAFMKTKSVDLLRRIMNRLTADDLDFLLGETLADDYAAMSFLIDNGARFGSRYYRGDTFEKMNGLLRRMMKKERE